MWVNPHRGRAGRGRIESNQGPVQELSQPLTEEPRMLPSLRRLTCCLLLVGATSPPARAADADDLVIVKQGKTSAVVAVSPKAGVWEKRAAEDLVAHIALM